MWKCLFLAITAGAAQAAPLAYWDFNNETLMPSLGTVTETTANYVGVGIGVAGFGAGTSVNSFESPAGRALTFLDVANVFSEARFQFTGLNLSPVSDVTLSFAFRSDHLFAVEDRLTIEYNIGSGWVEAHRIPLPTPGNWELLEFSLPQLDNQPSVGVRINTLAVIDVGKTLGLDNVQVIPEAKTAGLLLIALAVLLLLKNGRLAPRGSVPTNR